MNNGAIDAGMTELERVKMENFGLKHNAIQQQLQGNLAERAAFIQQMEAAHPGFKWEEQKGLVPIAGAQTAAKGNNTKPGARTQ